MMDRDVNFQKKNDGEIRSTYLRLGDERGKEEPFS